MNVTIAALHREESERKSAIVRAEIVGPDQCSAEGVTAISSSPVIALCRKLVAAGHDPASPLKAYRGMTLCLSVHSIGEAAGREINGRGTGFKRCDSVGIGPPVAPVSPQVGA
jgi:hypothetical protein